MWNGKKLARFRVPQQLRADEKMVREIQRFADRDDRPWAHQLFHFARLGIIHAKKCERKARFGARSHRV
jgi:hypothetical protein